jgi:iron-sulfur cluster repair protein YtfE (RIC family)
MAETSMPRHSTTGLLTVDHRRLDALLAEVKRCAAESDLPRAQLQFVELRRGLERHIAVEEEIVFPAYETLTRMRGAGPIEVMRLEHRQIRQLLSSVAALLSGGDAKARTTGLGELTALLLAHHGKEDRVVYPLIDAATDGVVEPEKLALRIEAHLSHRDS